MLFQQDYYSWLKIAENPEQQATSGAGGPAIDPEVSPTDIDLKIEDIDLAPEVDRGAGLGDAASVVRNIARNINPERLADVGVAGVAGVAVTGAAVVVASPILAVAGATLAVVVGGGALAVGFHDAVLRAAVLRNAAADARGLGPADKSINNFWSKNNDKVGKAVRKALEKGTVNPDPQVIEIRAGSLLVKLRCHTPRSFLQFDRDYKSQKVNQRLEEELSTVGFEKKLTIDVENKEEVEEKKKKLRYVSLICEQKS